MCAALARFAHLPRRNRKPHSARHEKSGQRQAPPPAIWWLPEGCSTGRGSSDSERERLSVPFGRRDRSSRGGRTGVEEPHEKLCPPRLTSNAIGNRQTTLMWTFRPILATFRPVQGLRAKPSSGASSLRGRQRALHDSNMKDGLPARSHLETDRSCGERW